MAMIYRICNIQYQIITIILKNININGKISIINNNNNNNLIIPTKTMIPILILRDNNR